MVLLDPVQKFGPIQEEGFQERTEKVRHMRTVLEIRVTLISDSVLCQF